MGVISSVEVGLTGTSCRDVFQILTVLKKRKVEMRLMLAISTATAILTFL